jgi:hypothetical protein
MLSSVALTQVACVVGLISMIVAVLVETKVCRLHVKHNL